MAEAKESTTIVEALKALIDKLGGDGSNEATTVEALGSVYKALGGTDDVTGIDTIAGMIDKVTSVMESKSNTK